MPRKAKVISEENKRPYYGTMFDPPTNTRRATEKEAVNKKQVKWYGMKLVSDEVSKQLGRSRKQIQEDVKKIDYLASKELEKVKKAQIDKLAKRHDEQQGTTVKRRLELVTDIKSMKQKEISIEKLGILENKLDEKLKEIIEEEKKEHQLNKQNLVILNEIKKKEQKNVAKKKKIVKDAIVKVNKTKAKVIKSTANLPVVKEKVKRTKKKDSQKKSNHVAAKSKVAEKTKVDAKTKVAAKPKKPKKEAYKFIKREPEEFYIDPKDLDKDDRIDYIRTFRRIEKRYDDKMEFMEERSYFSKEEIDKGEDDSIVKYQKKMERKVKELNDHYFN